MTATAPRPECLGDFRNNCVLVALKEITGRPDAEILAAVRRHGYRNNHGMYKADYMRAAAELGVVTGQELSHWDMSKIAGRPGKITVARAIKTHLQTGTWLVRTSGHVFVVRNGRLVDRNMGKSGLGRGVVDVTRVVNPYVAAKVGVVVVRRHNCRRRGTSARARFDQMAAFLRLNPRSTKEAIFAACRYDAVDFAWDLSRGNIEIV